jgi:hypothetical protein
LSTIYVIVECNGSIPLNGKTLTLAASRENARQIRHLADLWGVEKLRMSVDIRGMKKRRGKPRP